MFWKNSRKSIFTSMTMHSKVYGLVKFLREFLCTDLMHAFLHALSHMSLNNCLSLTTKEQCELDKLVDSMHTCSHVSGEWMKYPHAHFLV